MEQDLAAQYPEGYPVTFMTKDDWFPAKKVSPQATDAKESCHGNFARVYHSAKYGALIPQIVA